MPRLEPGQIDAAVRFVRARIPDARLEYAGQAGDAQSGDFDHPATDIACGIIRREVVEYRLGLGVLVAEDPVYRPAQAEQRCQSVAQRQTQFAVAEQDQGAWCLRGARTQDRREIAVRIAGDDNAIGHARHRDQTARPKPSSRAAGPIVQPCMTSDMTTTTNTPENSRSSRSGSARAGMKLI